MIPLLHIPIYVGLAILAYVVYQKYKIPGHKFLPYSSVTAYFPPHQTKIRYLELSEQYSIDDAHGHKLLCTALLKRAMTDVERIWKLREEKAPLQQLVGKGAISHEVWEGLLAAEASMESEIQELMEESELLKPGWGQTIFSEATNLLKIQMQKEAEKQMAEESAKMARAAKEADEDADYEDIKDSPVELDDTARLKLAEELIQEEEAEKKKQAQNANRKGSGGGKKKK